MKLPMAVNSNFSLGRTVHNT